jgi:hypothetical protein
MPDVSAPSAGWTSIRAGRRPGSGADFRPVDLDQPDTLERAVDGIDLIVSTVPDERLVAERLVLTRGGMLINVSAKSAVGPVGSRFAHRALTREIRRQTTVVPLPEPFGRRRCVGFAEADNGWLGAVAGTVLFGRSLATGARSLTGAGVLVPEDAFTIGELRSALAESEIVVVDEQEQ